MKAIHFLCCAHDFKPYYILRLLLEEGDLDGYSILLMTDDQEGRVIDLCKKYLIPYTVIDNHMDNFQNIKSETEYDNTILVSLGWSNLVPKSVLDQYAKCINCHGGYLPDYRGASAYMAVYANIEKEYGVTIHYMTENFDNGNIIKQVKLKLFLEETPRIIHYRMCELIAFILPESIRLAFENYPGKCQKGRVRFFNRLSRMEMDRLRNQNIDNLIEGKKLETAACKEWNLD